MRTPWTKEEKEAFRAQHPMKYPVEQAKHKNPKADVKAFAGLERMPAFLFSSNRSAFASCLAEIASLTGKTSDRFVGYWDFTRPSLRFPTGNTGSHPPRTAQMYR